MHADGSGQRLLLGGRPSDGLPAWSPDGKRIAFVRDAQIAIMNADGEEVRLLARGSRKGTHPQWSPDGRRILFTGDPWGIYVMNADGSNPAEVPIAGQAAGASWGPSS
jgi:Tol biopolymer transport system component